MQFNTDIIALEGLSIDWTVAQEQLVEMLGESNVYQPTASGRFAGEARLDDDTVSVTGVLETALHVPCSRCASFVAISKPLRMRLTFVPEAALETLQENEDESCNSSLDDIHVYRDKIIELVQAIKDELILSLPLKVLCDESCRGLCANCGINRNEASCACEERSIDPRLMALADIRLGAANQQQGK